MMDRTPFPYRRRRFFILAAFPALAVAQGRAVAGLPDFTELYDKQAPGGGRH
jgi:hypothetical protein